MRMQLHAATKILLWVLLAALLQSLPIVTLSLMSGILLLLMFYNKTHNYFLLLRRTRWLMISLLMIYGYASPGDPVLPMLGAFSPIIQGVQAGAMQVWRLLMLLAGLAVLFSTTTQEDLLTGLYVIMRPFNRFGMNAEKITLRVWLTLNYAKQMGQDKKPLKWKSLSDALANVSDKESEVHLEVSLLQRKDKAILLFSFILGGLLLL